MCFQFCRKKYDKLTSEQDTDLGLIVCANMEGAAAVMACNRFEVVFCCLARPSLLLYTATIHDMIHHGNIKYRIKFGILLREN